MQTHFLKNKLGARLQLCIKKKKKANKSFKHFYIIPIKFITREGIRAKCRLITWA